MYIPHHDTKVLEWRGGDDAAPAHDVFTSRDRTASLLSRVLSTIISQSASETRVPPLGKREETMAQLDRLTGILVGVLVSAFIIAVFAFMYFYGDSVLFGHPRRRKKNGGKKGRRRRRSAEAEVVGVVVEEVKESRSERVAASKGARGSKKHQSSKGGSKKSGQTSKSSEGSKSSESSNSSESSKSSTSSGGTAPPPPQTPQPPAAAHVPDPPAEPPAE